MFAYYCHHYAATSVRISLTGPATTAVYQQALSAITYVNTADEPTMDPPRRVQMQVYDGIFNSASVTGFVNIVLVDDNRLMLACGGLSPPFTEESTDSLLIANSLNISDLDSNSMIHSATVMLENAVAGDEIQVDPSTVGGLTLEQSSGVSVSISGQAMAAEYQVR